MASPFDGTAFHDLAVMYPWDNDEIPLINLPRYTLLYKTLMRSFQTHREPEIVGFYKVQLNLTRFTYDVTQLRRSPEG